MNRISKLEDRIECARLILHGLFSEMEIDDYKKTFYSCVFHTTVENFIYTELLSVSNVIHLRIASSKGKRKLPLIGDKLATVYFLNCRLNAKLDRCESSKYQMSDIDETLADYIIEAAREKRIETEGVTAQSIFKRAAELSFQYDGTNVTYRYVGPNSIKDKAHTIILSVSSLKDSEIKNYSEYIDYLLSLDRNSIANFKSSSFWQNAFGKGRSTTLAYDYNAPDLDIARLCIGLGFDEAVYDKLLFLRDNDPQSTNVKRFTEKEESIIREELRNIRKTFYSVMQYSQCSDSKEIPRIMLEIVERSLKKRKCGLSIFPSVKQHE